MAKHVLQIHQDNQTNSSFSITAKSHLLLI